MTKVPGPTDVAVVGLGLMGQRMAGRLLDQGYRVHVWNRSPAATEALAAAGAIQAVTPRQAAENAGTVITMLTDGAALSAVVSGPDGIGACSRSVTLVQTSTVSPDEVRSLSGQLPAGSILVDAPVLGSVAEAGSGTLHLLVGAADADYRQCLPLLRALGTPQLVGPLGTGAAAKLVANSTLFGMVGVLAESLRLADALGLDTDAAFGVLAATPLAAQAERRRPAIAEGTYSPRFALSLARKDAELVVAATEPGTLRLAEAMRDRLREAEAVGLGGLDYTAILGHMLSA
jgi:3-hydroxyisobutyrate dehydrogenase-like beta-hydroxyacid dehydrogenase